MKILITGGAGYLGSILSKKLLDKGYQVRVMDALWYGIEPIEDCLDNNNFELVKEDIRNLTSTVSAFGLSVLRLSAGGAGGVSGASNSDGTVDR